MGNLLHWTNEDSFDEINGGFGKAAVFKSYCDLPNHSVIITGVFPGWHFGASAHTSENSLIFLPINLADNILVL